MAEETILLVEDDPRWQMDLTEILEEAGYRVRLAGSYDEAVMALKDWTVKVAVVDVSLIPGNAEDRQGRDLMELIRIPVVCISGVLPSGEVGEIFNERLVGWFFDKRRLEDKKEQFLEAVALAVVESNARVREEGKTRERWLRSGD